jgi:hypothetical protein
VGTCTAVIAIPPERNTLIGPSAVERALPCGCLRALPTMEFAS